ncbi:MAG: DNA alkylation repair protein [Bacteroidota bacterium]
MTFDDIISKLNEMANPEKIAIKAQKFGIIANNALGIYHQDLKALAREIPKDDQLAIKLFESDIYEARLLCSKLFNPKNLTESLMDKWVSTFENWEICDSFCMGLFAKSNYAVPKAIEWTERTKEFEKRAGFATIAAYCMADKKSTNEIFKLFFPTLLRESTDERQYVKKAVNWALRNLGKRNKDLNKNAISVAYQILEINSKSAKWIGKNALKELEKDNVRIADYPREHYRKKL